MNLPLSVPPRPAQGWACGRPIGINSTESSSTSVGAREVGSGGEGLYGRPRPVPLAHLWGNALTPPAPGDHKGLVKIPRIFLAPPPPNRPRPYGIRARALDWCLLRDPCGRPATAGRPDSSPWGRRCRATRTAALPGDARARLHRPPGPP